LATFLVPPHIQIKQTSFIVQALAYPACFELRTQVTCSTPANLGQYDFMSGGDLGSQRSKETVKQQTVPPAVYSASYRDWGLSAHSL